MPLEPKRQSSPFWCFYLFIHSPLLFGSMFFLPTPFVNFLFLYSTPFQFTRPASCSCTTSFFSRLKRKKMFLCLYNLFDYQFKLPSTIDRYRQVYITQGKGRLFCCASQRGICTCIYVMIYIYIYTLDTGRKPLRVESQDEQWWGLGYLLSQQREN